MLYLSQLFGVAVTLLHKTWKEMEAQLADLEKVMGVVRKQLEMILAISSSAGTTASSEDAIMGLKRMVDRQTYDDVRSSYIQKDEMSYSRQLTSDALISLKAQKRDQYQVVVCEQRFAFMTHGAWFSTIKPKGRGTLRSSPAQAPPPHTHTHTYIHTSAPGACARVVGAWDLQYGFFCASPCGRATSGNTSWTHASWIHLVPPSPP